MPMVSPTYVCLYIRTDIRTYIAYYAYAYSILSLPIVSLVCFADLWSPAPIPILPIARKTYSYVYT